MKLEMQDGFTRDWFSENWNVNVQRKTTEVVFCTWERAKSGEYTLNTDGTLQGSSGGWATVIRDTNGEVVATAHGKSKYKSIAFIELNALEKGLELAIRHNTTRLKAQTDSTNVVSFMKQGSKPQWQASRF